MHNYKELKLWQKAIQLAKIIYSITSSFPSEEKFGLTGQVRRAVVSIASNIAEGAGRNSNKEFIQFVAIATGSAYEVETQMIIAKELEYTGEEEVMFGIIEELQKMLYAFSNRLKENETKR